MLQRSCPSWALPAFLLAVLLFSATFCVAQQPLPDAPTPQKNAPSQAPAATPDPTAPLPDANTGSSTTNPPDSGNTRGASDDQTGPTNPQAPPPGSQGIKTVPAGKGGSGPGNDYDELFTLTSNVNFVSVPVTVKEHD